MRQFRSIVLVSAMLAGSAVAQTAPQPAGEASASGVLSYPPAFFASSNPGTALDMVQRLPGFTVDIGDVDARGLAGAAGNVLIDGARPSSKSDNLAQVLGRIPAAGVERIDLIRGGAPGIDMHGRSVIANVVLKRTANTEIAAESNTFVYDDGAVGTQVKGSWSGREGDRLTEVSFSAATDRSSNTTRGMRTRIDPSGVALQSASLDVRDRYSDFDIRGALQRPLFGGKLHVNAVFDRFASHDTQATTILSGAGDDELVRERSSYPNGEFGFTWTREPGPRSTIEVTGLQRLNHNPYTGRYDSADSESVFDSDATGGESVLRATNLFRPNAAWSFEGGGEIAYNFLDSDSHYAADGVNIPLPNAAVFVSEIRGDAFAQGTWRRSPKLTIDATMRVELSRISQSGDTSRARSFVYPKPRLQVTWLPRPGHQFRLRLEKEVGQLDFGDFAASSDIALGTVAAGNADLRPARSTVAELVYERRFWKKGVFELTARHTALADVIDTIPLVGGFDATGNIGGAHSDVVRAALALPFDRLGLKDGLLKLDVAWRQSAVIDPLTGVARNLSYQQPFDCNIAFTQDLKGGRFSYGFEHGCDVARTIGYRSAEVRTERRPPFAYLYGQWKPSARLTLRVDVGNLVNGARQTLRDVYAWSRDTAPIVFREDRSTRRGRYVYFQIRKIL